MNNIKIITTLILSITLLCGCEKENKVKVSENSVVLKLNSFANESSSTEQTLSEIDMFIFQDGILNSILSDKLEGSNKISVIFNENDNTKVFFLADPNQITDYSNLVIGESLESDFIKMKTRNLDFGKKEDVAPLYIGVTDFKKMEMQNKVVNMRYAVARMDMKIKSESKVEVLEIKITDLSTGSYVINNGDDIDSESMKMDFESTFTEPLTSDTQGICYLFEQKTNNSQIEIKAKYNGIKTIIRANLPSNIERNKIYNLNISGLGSTLNAEIIPQAWEVEDDVNAKPDLLLAKINTTESQYPEYIRVSADLDTLFVPSVNESIKLVISSLMEIDVEIDGDSEGVITALPSEGNPLNHSFEITTERRTFEQTIFLKVKNKTSADYQGDRIVIILEKNETEYTGALFDYLNKDLVINFNKYTDGDWGTIKIPKLSTIETLNIPEWIKFEEEELISSDYSTYRVLGGFRPNNMAENGTVQEYTFKIKHQSGVTDEIKISRISNSLPVVNVDNQYWCMYNLQGNARKFEDQILTLQDDLFEYLKTCSDQEFITLMGDGYKGTDLNGMNVKYYTVTESGVEKQKLSFENYAESNLKGQTGSIKTCPDGYMIPEISDMENVLANFTGTNLAVPIFWTYKQMMTHLFVKNNLVLDGQEVKDVTHVYYSKSRIGDTVDNPTPKLVFYGLGYQENNMDLKPFQSLFTMGKIGRFWGVFNEAYKMNSQGNHIPTDVTVRYIRCIKEPGFFIY